MYEKFMKTEKKIFMELAEQVYETYYFEEYLAPNPQIERYLFKMGRKEGEEVEFFPPNDVY